MRRALTCIVTMAAVLVVGAPNKERGLTSRPGTGGGLGEDTAPQGSIDGPRGLPQNTAPGYEEADKGKTVKPTVGGQRDFKPPLGPPEDPVPLAGTGR